MAKGDYRQLNSCRICGGNFDSKSLKLVDTPLANELYKSKEESLNAEKFPLELVICKDCCHVQLKHIVSAKRLFSNYVYRSGTSSFFQSHFADLAAYLKNLVPQGSLVIEIGSNDGLLLREIERKGAVAVGIEPSEQLASLSRNLGSKVKTGFLSKSLIDEIIVEFGKASAVVGNNVFAHIDDLLSAFKLVNALLRDGGIFIFEVADFEKLVGKGLFDTIYHEHMSYHTVIGVLRLCELSDFFIETVDEIEPHGGSLRFKLRKGWREGQISENVRIRLEKEKELGLDTALAFDEISKTISQKKNDLGNVLSNPNVQTKLVGYGAPAKLVTFCYQIGLTPQDLEYVIDDNEFKQDFFVPGLGYKIVPSKHIQEYVKSTWRGLAINYLVFPWNLSSEIISKLSKWAPPGSNIVQAFPSVESRTLN